jgi:hypothetical protein
MNGWHEKTGVNKTGGRFRLPVSAARFVRRGKTGTLGFNRHVELKRNLPPTSARPAKHLLRH